jgi:replication factor C small subunit
MEIWTEKYRPKGLADVVNQRHVVDRLKAWVESKSIPHLLFAGPAGTGKTCCAIALARELFGSHWHENFQETNASDERGIDVVRGRIKDFARVRPIGAEFKIVFLDESDSLTPEAQQALRRTIEKFSDVCRFILSCNYSNKIIDPIQSRAAVFRFRRLEKDDVAGYLGRIAEGEKLKIGEGAFDAIYEISGGDMRRAVNLLQSTAALGEVSRDTVYSVANQAKPQDIKDMMELAIKGDFKEARKMLYSMLINQGLAGEDIIKGMHQQVFGLELDDEKKAALVDKVGEFEFRITQGGTPEVQLEALLAQFMGANR